MPAKKPTNQNEPNTESDDLSQEQIDKRFKETLGRMLKNAADASQEQTKQTKETAK